MDVILNGLTLAYIGDSYYELLVRMYLIDQKLTAVNDLHKRAILFTSAQAQSQIINHLIDDGCLANDEIDLYKRGRNAAGRGRHNVDAKTYAQATGFEALIGGLYLLNQKRADDLIVEAIKWIEKGKPHGKSGGKENE